MFNVLENTSWSTRVQMGLRLIGATSDEVGVLDRYVRDVTSHPAAQLVVGGQINSVQDAADKLSTSTGIADSPWIGTAKRALHNPDMRRQFATLMEGFLPKDSGDRETIFNLLGKVVDSPFSDRSSSEINTTQDLIDYGLLEPIAKLVPEELIEQASVFHRCPYCSEIFQK